MKRIILLLLLAAFFVSCQSNSTQEKAAIPADSGFLPGPGIDPDPTDSIPFSGYDPATSDYKAAELIKKALKNTILAKDLPNIPEDQHKFKYQAFDLNNDSLPEYFVAMIGSYFCPTGGCSAYLLDNSGNLINSFVGIDFPIYAAFSTTGGWQDLIVKSNSKFHLLKIKDGKYPLDPTKSTVFKGKPMLKGTEVLDLAVAPYPTFLF